MPLGVPAAVRKVYLDFRSVLETRGTTVHKIGSCHHPGSGLMTGGPSNEGPEASSVQADSARGSEATSVRIRVLYIYRFRKL